MEPVYDSLDYLTFANVRLRLYRYLLELILPNCLNFNQLKSENRLLLGLAQ